MTAASSDHLSRLPESARVEACSDGVLAIAVTLLVLDLHSDRLNSPMVSWDGSVLLGVCRRRRARRVRRCGLASSVVATARRGRGRTRSRCRA